MVFRKQNKGLLWGARSFSAQKTSDSTWRIVY